MFQIKLSKKSFDKPGSFLLSPLQQFSVGSTISITLHHCTIFNMEHFCASPGNHRFEIVNFEENSTMMLGIIKMNRMIAYKILLRFLKKNVLIVFKSLANFRINIK